MEGERQYDRTGNEYCGILSVVLSWDKVPFNPSIMALRSVELMNSHFRRINRNMIIGWLIIVLVLLVTYVLEVVKGERSFGYLFAFMSVVVLPALLVFVLYLKKPDWKSLCYFIVPGYFVMYIFVMLTGSTTMVFTYILPMLSLLILYHHPRLILFTGLAALIVNGASIYQNYLKGVLTLANSKDAEIQIALIALCFGGSYAATRLYDDITEENRQYMQMLNTKNEQIQRMTMQTISAIANTLDAKDPYTEGHARRVSAYCVQMALELGMSKEDAENLRLVALFHDIGKVGVPDSVLKKPGRLNDEEFEEMKQHTIVGSDIIKDLSMVPGIFIGARYHHERYDGSGYPEGLKGEEIPYIARIIAVADAYDAMTTDRVYRKHLSIDQVLIELERGAGTQFDPDIVDATIKLVKSGELENLSPDMKMENE